MLRKSKFLLIGTLSLHALVAGPLLVQCTTADGHALIELLGHDPCRLQSSTARTGNGSVTAVNPCSDSLMANPAVIHPGIDAPVSTACLSHESSLDPVSPRWKPGRETAPRVRAGPRLEFCLRV